MGTWYWGINEEGGAGLLWPGGCGPKSGEDLQPGTQLLRPHVLYAVREPGSVGLWCMIQCPHDE